MIRSEVGVTECVAVARSVGEPFRPVFTISPECLALGSRVVSFFFIEVTLRAQMDATPTHDIKLRSDIQGSWKLSQPTGAPATMESVPERHAAPRELQAAPEVAHELAREREPGEAGGGGRSRGSGGAPTGVRCAVSGTGSPGACSTTPPSPDTTLPPASRRAIPRPQRARLWPPSGSTRSSGTSRPRPGRPPGGYWSGSGAKDWPGAGAKWWVSAGSRRPPPRRWPPVVEGPSGVSGTLPFSPSCRAASSGSPGPPRCKRGK